MFGLEAIYDNPFFRYLEFIIGVILFREIKDIKNKRLLNLLKKPIVIIGEFAVLVVSVNIFARIIPTNYMLFSWIGLPMFSLLITSLYLADFSRVSATVVLTISRLSAISYGFYLAQFFTWPLGAKILEIIKMESNFFRIALSFTICMILALILHFLIEQPSKHILKRYY